MQLQNASLKITPTHAPTFTPTVVDSPGLKELFARNECERLSTLRESANKKLAGSGARRGKEWGEVLDSSKPDFPKACNVA